MLKAVDSIELLHFVGGEPFLHKKGDKLLKEVTSREKIKMVVVITNGTIVPNENMVRELKNPKVMVRLSQYPEEVAKNRQRVIECLETNHINYFVNLRDNWSDPGDFSRTKSQDKVVKMTSTCYSMTFCRDLLKGRFYPCERMAAATELGYIKDDPRNYVDLRKKTSSSALRKELEHFYATRFFPCCTRCNIADCADLPPAEQAKKGEKLAFPTWKEQQKIDLKKNS